MRRRDPIDERRDERLAGSSLASLLLHLLAVAFLVSLAASSSQESANETTLGGEMVTISQALPVTHQVATPQPVRPRPQPPRPIPPHPHVQHPAPPKHVASRPVQTPHPMLHELTHVVPHASPNPTPVPVVTPQPLPVPTLTVAVVQPTVAPTPKPTAQPTLKPVPTEAPTVKPAPTAKPVPTAAPTPKPRPVAVITPAPTAKPIPTARPAPTAAPTRVPTAAPAPVAARTVAPQPTAAATPRAVPSPAAKPHVAPANTPGVPSPRPVIAEHPAAGRASPGPQSPNAGHAKVPERLIELPPTPRPTPRPRPSPAPTRNPYAGLNARLNALLPNGPVVPHEGHYIGSLSLAGRLDPTPPPDVVARTKYIFEGVAGGGDGTIKMWVTSITRRGPVLVCNGWLLHYPATIGEGILTPSNVHVGPVNGIQVGGQHQVPSGFSAGMDPIVIGMGTTECTRRALVPFAPPASSP